MNDTIYDLLIIGGGINGAGIAADAAGRDLKVMLCEQYDLASGTSSASSKLIHGGLRYLEHYEFRLVREALAEREVLLKIAPHLVQPLKFTLPHRPHLRPAWMIRSGLFLYDHLSKRNSLPATRSRRFESNSPLQAEIKRGFDYYDCKVDDARLVITNAVKARQLGADIRTRTRCVKARRDETSGLWEVSLANQDNGEISIVYSRTLINAAGPWLNKVIEHAVENTRPARNIRLIKGSHIIVPRIHDEDGAYILQNSDGRVVFVIPYFDQYSLIGTTDKEYQGKPEEVKIDEAETRYLLSIINQHFKKQISESDIIATYSGIRPLCDDESSNPSAITRDYTLEIVDHNRQAPLISIYGGKITTYRKLAEAVMKKLEPYFRNLKPAWTANQAMPGAAYRGQTLEQIRQQIAKAAPWLGRDLVNRYSCAYGIRCLEFLRNATSMNELGQDFGAGLYQAEVEFLVNSEWAATAEDILYRRSKLYLQMNSAQTEQLEAFISRYKHGENELQELHRIEQQLSA